MVFVNSMNGLNGVDSRGGPTRFGCLIGVVEMVLSASGTKSVVFVTFLAGIKVMVNCN